MRARFAPRPKWLPRPKTRGSGCRSISRTSGESAASASRFADGSITRTRRPFPSSSAIRAWTRDRERRVVRPYLCPNELQHDVAGDRVVLLDLSAHVGSEPAPRSPVGRPGAGGSRGASPRSRPDRSSSPRAAPACSGNSWRRSRVRSRPPRRSARPWSLRNPARGRAPARPPTPDSGVRVADLLDGPPGRQARAEAIRRVRRLAHVSPQKGRACFKFGCNSRNTGSRPIVGASCRKRPLRPRLLPPSPPRFSPHPTHERAPR